MEWVCTQGVFHCTEPKDSDDTVDIQGKANKADILVGVCYRLHNQNEEADEAFHEWLTEVPQVLPLVLMGDFTLMDVCWKLNTAERGQSRRSLSVWKITS